MSKNKNFSLIVEKFSAFIFLLLLVGMVGFLTYVPLDGGSKDAVMLIIGGLMTSATMVLPKLFGVNDDESEGLKIRLKALENDHEILKTKYSELKGEYDNILAALVGNYVAKNPNKDIQTL